MTYGIKIEVDSGIVQIDSDTQGKVYTPVRAGTGSGFLMDIKEFDTAAQNWTILARRTPSNGSWKSLFTEVYMDPPSYKVTSPLSITDGYPFNAAQGNSTYPTAVNLSTDRLTFFNINALSNGDELYYQTSNTLNGAGSSVSAIGGLTNGNKYYVVQKSGNTLKLSNTSGGSAINLTQYSLLNGSQTSNLVHSLFPSKKGIQFVGQTRVNSNTSPLATTGATVSDVSYVVLQKTGFLDTDSSLTTTDDFGLQIKNANNQIAFDSRYYTLSNVPYIVGAVLPGISDGAHDNSSNIILRTDYTEYPDHSAKPTPIYFGGNTTELYGYVFSRASSEYGTGIKWVGYVVNFFGTADFPPNPGTGFYQVTTL